MAEVKVMKKGLKILNRSAGAILIVLAFITIINHQFATLFAVIILSVSLLVLGATIIFVGFYFKEEAKHSRILKIVFGILSTSLAIIVISLQSLGIDIVIILLASAMIANGILRIIIAIVEKNLPIWYKVLTTLVGIITIFFGIVTLIFAQYGTYPLIILLSIIFILDGLTRIMYSMIN